MKDERYKKFTPRMLLNHSSGFYGSTMVNAFLFEDNDTYAHDSFLKKLADQSLKADPGDYSVYCNDCFTLAELMVEKVSGMDFTSYIHQYFTKPLGMSDTKTPLDQPDPSKLAALYYPKYNGQLPNESVNVIGTGGIYSTAEDMVRFSQIFTGQVNGILSAEAVTAMQQEEYKKGMWTQDADTSFGYGLGWDSVNLFPFDNYGIKALTKGGDTILFHSSLVVLPELNMAVAVLSTGNSSGTDQLLANEILLNALKEKGIISEFNPEKSYGNPVKADMPADLMNEAGFYGGMKQLNKVEINKDGEMILSSLQLPDSLDQTFNYTADGSFMSADGNAKISFVKKENGRIYMWTRVYFSLPELGQMALSQYSLEKLEENHIPPKTAAAWNKRDGKTYYLINEKYTSISYMINPFVKMELFKEVPGYAGDQKIIGPNTSSSDLQIPAMAGRDNQPYIFFTKDGFEYLDVVGYLFVREDAVKPIYSDNNSSLTIPSNSNAKWYTVPEKFAGKTLQVMKKVLVYTLA
jgi:CubicO group peptidase (beta-lactamase class C family)